MGDPPATPIQKNVACLNESVTGKIWEECMFLHNSICTANLFPEEHSLMLATSLLLKAQLIIVLKCQIYAVF